MPPHHAAAKGPIDLDHLREMTLGDAALQREVLRLFVAQSAGVRQALATLPDDAAGLAHKLKGSARAIGAFGVADAAAALEVALQTEAGARQAVTRLDVEVGEALAAAAALLRQSGE